MQIASLISDALDTTLKIEPGIGEGLLAKWFPSHPESITSEEIVTEHSRADLSYRSPAKPLHSETEIDVDARFAEAAGRLLREFEGDLLLVGHGISGLALCHALVRPGVSVFTFLCCLIHFQQTETGWRLIRDGSYLSHLSIVEEVHRLQ